MIYIKSKRNRAKSRQLPLPGPTARQQDNPFEALPPPAQGEPPEAREGTPEEEGEEKKRGSATGAQGDNGSDGGRDDDDVYLFGTPGRIF